jgi:hypothetical protein
LMLTNYQACGTAFSGILFKNISFCHTFILRLQVYTLCSDCIVKIIHHLLTTQKNLMKRQLKLLPSRWFLALFILHYYIAQEAKVLYLCLISAPD